MVGRVGWPEPARLFGLKTALHRPLVSRAGDGGHPLRLEHTSVRCARKSFACFAGARLNANDPAGQERVSEKSLHAYSAVLDVRAGAGGKMDSARTGSARRAARKCGVPSGLAFFAAVV